MGQSAHPAPLWRVCALVAASALGAVTLNGCASSVAAATTTLAAAINVTVVHSNGSAVAGVAGMRLDPGDLVRTGPGGRADLLTRTRHVYVGSDGSLQVLDGARDSLRHGAVVVDAQHGPGLRLDMGGLSVTAVDGTAVRAERSATERVGALAGSTRVVSVAGRSLTVPALRQVVTGGDALPDRATPLRLTDDDAEAHTVPELVRADEALIGVARGIDGTGPATARVVAASWQRPLAPTPTGVAPSERVLPIVIAAAGRGDALRCYHAAVAYRRAGGSWGVVASLVGVAASNVVNELAVLERTAPAGQIGDVRQVLAALAASDAASGGGGGATRVGNGGGNSGGGQGGGGSGSGGGSGGGPSSSPSPSPSGTVGQVTDTVNNTVGQVLSVLPSPTPTPSTILPTALTSPLPLPVAP
jgi:hypothetical protein